MKIFVSWSGDYGKKIAEKLKSWIEDTFDDTSVWYSTVDIGLGDEWNPVIRKELARTHFGIICVTDYSENRPWVLFEAGALSKQVDKSCVIPLLLGSTEFLKPPLGMFQPAHSTKDGIRTLFKRIHEKKQGRRLKIKSKEFEPLFATKWKKHGGTFLKIKEEYTTTKLPSPPDETESIIENLVQSRSTA